MSKLGSYIAPPLSPEAQARHRAEWRQLRDGNTLPVGAAHAMQRERPFRPTAQWRQAVAAFARLGTALAASPRATADVRPRRRTTDIESKLASAAAWLRAHRG